MISEARRRAYLGAMQVDVWLPRTVLPFAAPSRAVILQPLAEVTEQPLPTAVPGENLIPAGDAMEQPARPAKPALRVIVPEPKKPEAAVERPAPAQQVKPTAPTPRFALQLLRAGSVLLLVELPTGEPFQSRDPAYILLKDLLRAARLPDSPQQVGDGEPIRWPLLHGGSLDQGAEAARDYVQGVLAAELEDMGCDCIWLIGLPALQYAGEVGEDACYREIALEGLAHALAMPGLELLMEQPAAKAELWKALRRSMPRWNRGL